MGYVPALPNTGAWMSHHEDIQRSAVVQYLELSRVAPPFPLLGALNDVPLGVGVDFDRSFVLAEG